MYRGTIFRHDSEYHSVIHSATVHKALIFFLTENMMRTLFLFANLLVFIAQTSGQDHFYYTPNITHVPVLLQKNDGSAGVGMSWGSDYFAVEAQGVYSPVSHAAVMLNYFDNGKWDIRKNESQGTSYRFFELGLGGYYPLERGSASIFAGVGQGNLYNYYGAENYSDFTLRRFFIQPGLVYEDKFFTCGLTLRFSRLSYPKGQSSFDIDPSELESIRKIEEDSPFFLPELGLSGGLKFSPFSISINLTSVFPDVPGLNFSRFNSNLMLSLDFGEMKKRKQEKG